MDERLSVDFAMVSAVESVNDLQDQIWPENRFVRSRPSIWKRRCVKSS